MRKAQKCTTRSSISLSYYDTGQLVIYLTFWALFIATDFFFKHLLETGSVSPCERQCKETSIVGQLAQQVQGLRGWIVKIITNLLSVGGKSEWSFYSHSHKFSQHRDKFTLVLLLLLLLLLVVLLLVLGIIIIKIIIIYSYFAMLSVCIDRESLFILFDIPYLQSNSEMMQEGDECGTFEGP